MLDPRDRQTVSDVLDERVSRLGDKTWIVTGAKRYSFGQMQKRAIALAERLPNSRHRQGETVLLMLPDGIDIITCWLALARLGALEVPVNTQLRGNALKHVLANSLAKTLVVDRRFLRVVEPLLAEVPSIERLILTGEGDPQSHRCRRNELAALMQTAATCSYPHRPRAHDLLAVMYTSGTTGPSKGVMVTHTHAYEYALSVVELLEMREDDVYYNPLPLFHIAGQWAARLRDAHPRRAPSCCPAPSRSRASGRTCAGTAPPAPSCSAPWRVGSGGSRRRQTIATTPMERMLIVPLLPEVEAFKTRFNVLVSTTWGSTEINVPMRSTFGLANNKTCGRVANDRYEVRIVDQRRSRGARRSSRRGGGPHVRALDADGRLLAEPGGHGPGLAQPMGPLRRHPDARRGRQLHLRRSREGRHPPPRREHLLDGGRGRDPRPSRRSWNARSCRSPPPIPSRR